MAALICVIDEQLYYRTLDLGQAVVSNHLLLFFQDINKRLSLPVDIHLPESFLVKQSLSPLSDGPMNRRLRRVSLVSSSRLSHVFTHTRFFGFIPFQTYLSSVDIAKLPCCLFIWSEELLPESAIDILRKCPYRISAIDAVTKCPYRVSAIDTVKKVGQHCYRVAAIETLRRCPL